MAIDVELARSLTPGTRHVTHLNNAGAALQPEPVLDAVRGYIEREATIGGYEAEAEAADRIAAVYGSIAALMGAQPHEIALVESATAAWNAAFIAIEFRPGDRILTGRTEYISNAINLLAAKERFGVEIVLIDDDAHGSIDLDALQAAIDDRTKLIALTHIATGGGLVNPAADVGAIARDAGVLYLLDACQSVGQRVTDVEALGCDILSATGRKFLRAPRGTGFLYVRSSVIERLRPLRLDMRSAEWTSPTTYSLAPDARRFEEFECNVANRLGLGAAVDYARSIGMGEIAARTTELAAQLRRMLAEVPGVAVRDKGVDRCAIVTFSVAGVGASEVKTRLNERSINTSVTTQGSSQFDFPQRGLTELVRASPHYYNTEDELALLVDALPRA
jgi:selenocysteine lyase/cysteine desulfurase